MALTSSVSGLKWLWLEHLSSYKNFFLHNEAMGIKNKYFFNFALPPNGLWSFKGSHLLKNRLFKKYYCTKVEVLAERQWDAVQCCNSMKGNDVISFKKTESCAYRLSSFYPLKNFTLRNISLKKIFKWIGIHFIFNWSV